MNLYRSFVSGSWGRRGQTVNCAQSTHMKSFWPHPLSCSSKVNHDSWWCYWYQKQRNCSLWTILEEVAFDEMLSTVSELIHTQLCIQVVKCTSHIHTYICTCTCNYLRKKHTDYDRLCKFLKFLQIKTNPDIAHLSGHMQIHACTCTRMTHM